MSDNTINIESDSKCSVSPSSNGKMVSKSYPLSSTNGNFESGIIYLIGDPKMEGVSGDSLYESFF